VFTFKHDYEGANHHEDGLNEVGPDDGGKSTKDGEKRGQTKQDENGQV